VQVAFEDGRAGCADVFSTQSRFFGEVILVRKTSRHAIEHGVNLSLGRLFTPDEVALRFERPAANRCRGNGKLANASVHSSLFCQAAVSDDASTERTSLATDS
jgi:hypothetical protein